MENKKEDARVTVLLPDELAKNIRKVQADMMLHFDCSISFSSVISALATVGLKDIGQTRALLRKKYG